MTSRKAAISAASLALNTTALAALRQLPSAPAPYAPPSRSAHPTRPTEPLRPATGTTSAAPDDQPTAAYPVSLPITTIGRSLNNAIAIPDPAVSRQHARLYLEDSGWWIENISTRGLLWVGGESVGTGQRALLTPGQMLRLGATRLQFLAPLAGPFSAQNSATPVGSPADQPDPFDPGVTLQFALRGKLSRSAGLALIVVALAIFLACAIVTLDVATLAGQVALANGGLRQALTALAIPIAPALGVALVVGALDRYEREPPVMMAAAFLWGAIIAIPPALTIERGIQDLLNPLLTLAPSTPARALAQAGALALTAGGVEELVKGAGLLLLLLALRDEFDNVTDGVIYGALIGAGFAMVENIVYFAMTPRAELGFLIVGRIALGWLTHSTFTALFGAGLGYIRETRDRRARWLAPLGGLVAAIGLHAYFDFIAYIATAASDPHAGGALAPLARLGPALPAMATGAAYLPLFLTDLALLNITLQALRREAATVRAYLAAETLTGVVTPAEYLLAQDARIRSQFERDCGMRHGPRAYLLARALYQTETGLAFRKWHVEMGDPPKRADRQPEDAYRERIPRLRLALARAVNQVAAL